jgi:hypothetical protein
VASSVMQRGANWQKAFWMIPEYAERGIGAAGNNMAGWEILQRHMRWRHVSSGGSKAYLCTIVAREQGQMVRMGRSRGFGRAMAVECRSLETQGDNI